MAYIGSSPIEKGTGLFSQDTFTGDGSTVAFDLTNNIPDGGSNDIQVFVDNVRQQEGSSNAYTVGQDGSGDFKRITFTAAPAASAAIYVLNPGTKNVQQVSTISDNTVTAAKVQSDAITTAKILDSNVTTAKIADSNVTTAKIAADAINATKIADDAISEEHLDVTAVIGNTELAEVAASGDILLVYDTSAGALKKILASRVGTTPPTFTSVSPSNFNTGDGTGNATFTITGTNFDATATAKLKTTAGVDVNFDTVTRNSATQITGVIAVSSLSNASEPYDVVVINGNGLQVTATDQININAQPVFVTGAGSLGTFPDGARSGISLSVNATDPESAGNVTFELQSGSLPAGLSLTNTAAEGGTAIISGNATAVGTNTTSNFVLRAVDAASNTTSRAFSITISAPASTSFTSSGTFAVPTGVSAVDVLVVAGGGAGQGKGGGPQGQGGGGGAGAGGLIFMPSYPVTPAGTVTVTVGDGGAGGPGNRPKGDDSKFGAPGDPGLHPSSDVLTAKGGGAGGGCNPNKDGGSGGGGTGTRDSCGPTLRGGGSATQPTQPGDSGAYGFGNNGGAGGTVAPVYESGAGGGGAGAAGTNGYSQQPKGNGGAGRAYTIADGTTPVYYAGGGGGAAGNGAPDPSFGDGGQGGGGTGANSTQGSGGGQATANRGGGGGAGGGRAPNSGGDGGKGIVIVRY